MQHGTQARLTTVVMTDGLGPKAARSDYESWRAVGGGLGQPGEGSFRPKQCCLASSAEGFLVDASQTQARKGMEKPRNSTRGARATRKG